MTGPDPTLAGFLRRIGVLVEDVTRTTGTPNPGVAHRVAENRVANGFDAVAPFDPAAPIGTQRRQIKAHNALLDRAVPGRDRICGAEEVAQQAGSGPRLQDAGPCILREGHPNPCFDDRYRFHMDAEQATRAERYLVHSHPDKTRRA